MKQHIKFIYFRLISFYVLRKKQGDSMKIVPLGNCNEMHTHKKTTTLLYDTYRH